MSKQDDVLALVQKSLKKLYTEQRYLIENRVSERSIVFWFGVYFHDYLKDSEFSDYDLDIEYNRNLGDAKRTRHFPRGTFPDLILHRRGSNQRNLLVMEFKPWWNNQRDRDIQKIKDFTHPEGNYNFELGLWVELGRNEAAITKVSNGEVIDTPLKSFQ